MLLKHWFLLFFLLFSLSLSLLLSSLSLNGMRVSRKLQLFFFFLSSLSLPPLSLRWRGNKELVKWRGMSFLEGVSMVSSLTLGFVVCLGCPRFCYHSQKRQGIKDTLHPLFSFSFFLSWCAIFPEIISQCVFGEKCRFPFLSLAWFVFFFSFF